MEFRAPQVDGGLTAASNMNRNRETTDTASGPTASGIGSRACEPGRGDPHSVSGAGALLLAAEDAADDGDAVVDLRRGARGVAEDETGLAGLLAVPGQRLCLHAAG